MPALDVMKYKYSFLEKDVNEVVQKLNEMFLGRFELVPSTDKYNHDKFHLNFVEVEPQQQHQAWKELVEEFYNGNLNALSLIEVVRHEAFEQYEELKMAFVKRAGRTDIPNQCTRCKDSAPEFTDMKGIYPSFATKVQWFESEQHGWSMSTELRDRNFCGFDPIFDHPEDYMYRQPEVVINDLNCPKCREAISKHFAELIKDL